jgi:diguanylate cyclase (GGDEF)-like protein
MAFLLLFKNLIRNTRQASQRICSRPMQQILNAGINATVRTRKVWLLRIGAHIYYPVTRLVLNNEYKSFWNYVSEAIIGPPPARLSRDHIIDALNATIRRSKNGQFVASVLFFEIDRFHHLEQTRDSAAIAHILRVIEERLVTGPSSRDMLRRLGGGRFAVFPSPNRTLTHQTLEKLAKEIQVDAARVIGHPTRGTKITVSVGYAVQTEMDVVNGETLFEAANTAFIAAVREGQGATCAFSRTMSKKVQRRRELAHDAKNALSSGCIHAHFQPQVDIVSQSIVGLEALARWKHSKMGILSPAEFLPILEEVGMMQDLGFVILRHALSALRDWDKSELYVPTVSINVSTEELLNPHLVEIVSMELDAFEHHPNRLVIEILETVVAGAKEDLIMQNINALRALGCAIDLDDFGTGHASITSIRQFGVDRIKIDRSFVTDIGEDTDQQQMVLAIMTMSKQLKIGALAEGVETESELAFMLESGCNIIQGHAIARPMPQSEVSNWMRTYKFGTTVTPTTQQLN